MTVVNPHGYGRRTTLSPESFLTAALPQILCHRIGRHHPASPQVLQPRTHIAQQVVVGQHLDRLP